jgi:hypothetical protein
MARLIWMVLQDGRSVVAGCAGVTREKIENALAEPGRTFTLTSDERIDVVPAESVRDFVVFDARSAVPSASAIYRLVRV